MVNVACGFAPRSLFKCLVVSPRGALADVALRHSRFAKRLVSPFQDRILRRADLFHATSEAEYLDIRSYGLKAPVAIIQNGIDIPEPNTLESKARNSGLRTLLYLGRIHPIKGLERLLRSWAELQYIFPDWQLRIAGPGDFAYVRDIQKMSASLRLQRVYFSGPAYGADKAKAYRSADLFVLPTNSENFGMVVAEALAYGLPAVVTQGAPWSGLEQMSCGWWIPADTKSLTVALRAALSQDAAGLAAMGNRGRDWMGNSFSWSTVGDLMRRAYFWILEGGPTPEFVRVD